MIQKRQTLLNALSSITQILVVSVTFFILYRFLLATIGIEQLGIWSLVMTFAGMSQIGSFGFSGGIVKFVAQYTARGETANVAAAVRTSLVFVGASTAVILIVGYPLFAWLVRLVVPAVSASAALDILPLALVSFWVFMMSGVLNGALDGLQRVDLRNTMSMADAVIFLIFAYYFAPRYGLRGVIIAKALGSSVILAATWLCVKRYVPSLAITRLRWDGALFREMLGYGVNFQMISITTLFYEPVTKGLLSRFGSLAFVGYYEMANRMVQQFRAIIVSSNQVIVPLVADLQERTPDRVKEVYLLSYRLLAYLALPLYSFIIVVTPLVARLWIGSYQEAFIAFASILAVGNLLNTIAGPAYFSNLGIGRLGWNLSGHLAIGILNAALGFWLGSWYGPFGVAVAWVAALGIGSAVIYLSFHGSHAIPFGELLPRETRPLAAACIAGTALALASGITLGGSIGKGSAWCLGAAAYAAVVIVPVWAHPMRGRLAGWLMTHLVSRRREA